MSQHTSHIDPDLQQHLQQILTRLQLDDAPAGGALVVYQAGECIARASVGMARQDRAWQADTLSLNFSTGKAVVATLIHVLASRGLLAYDTPIAHYWPAFGSNGKSDITLHHVLSHQANLFAITSIETDNDVLLDWDTMLDKVAAIAPSAPNKAEQYDSAYSALVSGWILGGVIEAVTEMSFADALRHYLTEPLGITDSCYFGVPSERLDEIARLAQDFGTPTVPVIDTDNKPKRRRKPVLKPESPASLEAYAALPSYACWQQLADNEDAPLTAATINKLYFDHSRLNLKNYKAALIPEGQEPIEYRKASTLQAIIPAANGIASAEALAILYAMIACGGVWQGKRLIDDAIVQQFSQSLVTGFDAIMPAKMAWRYGYHQIFHHCALSDAQVQDAPRFGHMGYNGSVAWCEPTRQLSFAFVHNFDVTMLNDVRQFALTEAVLMALDTELA
ncbi:serine hydrolase domain-containing protein [Psychrobacter aestuarii]|uniref:Serine hydrolase domain-containing protein n=1 Tax=Psychrobacter aestuarii TaxID=556327 RepID=A0ABP3FNA2_9GAMM|nr:serine hydrolase domain-containing protein [Psychrobacter aestuarii]